MPFGAGLKGADAMRSKVRRFKERFPDHFGAALYQVTGQEATEVERRTPVRDGHLKGSVHVVGPVRQWRRIYCSIVAGGPAAPYAIVVHENLEAFHKVGQAKYIESVINESRPHIAARVAARINFNQVL